MIRNNPPFNGKRFILNRNTMEIHDLENEKRACKIDEIKINHIESCNTYTAAVNFAEIFHSRVPNGCRYCIPEKDNG